MSLITRYRPKSWSELIGNDALVDSFVPALRARTSHAYLISGPSGCGKTTIARLAAQELKAEDNTLEIDAATHNGVEDMRELADSLNYKPMRGGYRCIIIDECQAITAQAWRALLKSVEEPPDWCFWFFCTTELNKVPINLRNRCLSYQVRPLTNNQLRKLLETVRQTEGVNINEAVINLCVTEAEGSPRRALTFLAQMSEQTTIEEARELIRNEPAEPDAIIQLARLLFERANWRRVRPVLESLKDENPETVRRIIEAYFTKVVLGNENENVVGNMVYLLDLFSQPIYNTTSMATIVRMVARWTLHMIPAIDTVDNRK
jgi:DNA polymerase III gamma/tau subunit